MRLGKLTNEKLKELVLDKFISTRGEVVVSPAIGEDCAAIDLGGDVCVLSTDPITAASGGIGTLAVHVCCNDAAACGAEPVGLLITLLVPPETTEDFIAHTAEEVAAAALSARVDVLGGHTEVTDAVTRPVISASVVARVPREGLVTADKMKPGDSILMTKWAGLEGTAILAEDHADELRDVWSEADFKDALSLKKGLSVVNDSFTARQLGEVTAMHDATEGGVLGAVWEMAGASGCGVFVDPEAIPMLSVTRRACFKLGLDPLRFISSGVLVIAARNGEALAKRLSASGIPAAVIGKALAKDEGLTLGKEPLAAPDGDELYKLKRK